MPIRDYKDDPYLSLLRPLVEAYLAFYRVGNRHIQSLGLTPGQFDVIAELEGTKGLTCAQLSEQTLTTKGTLTGVLDRLEHQGLIRRGHVGGDRRATKVQLTAKGTEVVKQVFPAHADFMRPFFVQALKPSEVQMAKLLLRRVRDSFNGLLNVPSVGLARREKASIKARTSRASTTSERKLSPIRQSKGQKKRLM